MKITLALGQFDVQKGDNTANITRAEALASEAAEAGADLLLLPELWINSFDLKNAEAAAAAFGTDYYQEISRIAEEYQLVVSGSNLCRAKNGTPRNSSSVVFPDGTKSAPYDKLHLFGPMGEQDWLHRGEQPVSVESKWGQIGLSICYDLRFPELFRRYALDGCWLVLLSAQWPYPRLEHWRALLKARAIENQMFTAACNRVGKTRDYEFFGHSAVIGPTGEVLLEMGTEPGLGIVEIDLSEAEAARKKMDVLSDFRSDIF